MSRSNIHLEFYGLPGCGKSTVSKLIAKNIKKSGYSVECASSQFGNDVPSVIRIPKKVFFAIRYIVRNPKQLKLINQIVDDNGYKNLLLRAKQFINITIKLAFYNKLEKGKIIIWDEGLVQAAISLSMNGCVSSKDNLIRLEALCNNPFKSVRIYIRTDCQEALNRMALRKTNNSRVERERNSTKRTKMLSMFESQCEAIVPQILVNGNDKIEDVKKSVLLKLKQYGVDI